MHRPLWLAALALWLLAGPVFLDPDPRVRDFGEPHRVVSSLPDLDDGDELVIIPRDAIRGDPLADGYGPVAPDEVLIPDTDPGIIDRAAVPVDGRLAESIGVGDEDPAATGGASLGVGRVGHFGTGTPSAFVSRRAGGGGHGGGGLGQGGGGGAGGGRAGRVRFGPVQHLKPGELVVPAGGEAAGLVFPLKSTAANADVAGWFAQTRMIQTFTNPLDVPLEAVYVFPLPASAAVDDFEMRVGSRRIVGVVRVRAEAEAMYAEALKRGHTASLLTQERSNVFTQRVGNIAPHTDVDVTVTYVHPLAYDHGAFEYVFPMTVGRRYCPPTMSAADRARVCPPVGDTAQRSARDVAVHVVLDAGAEVDEVTSPTHAVAVRRDGASRAVIDLERRGELPNRDFILRWKVAADALRAGCVTHRAEDGTGYFSAFLVPPLDGLPADPGPRELTLLLDASGSMDGAPFETLRRFSKRALAQLRRSDRFALIRFGGEIDPFSAEPVDATPENVASASLWLDECRVGGGTRMLPAVRRFAEMTPDGRFQRVAGFVTDGFVGNEDEILASLRAARGDSRWFAFGIGSSVNRMFIEGVAEEGRGWSEVVLPGEDGAAERAADRCLRRLDAPRLTGVTLDTNGLPLTDFGGARLNDVYEGQPVFVVGRYTAPGEGEILFRGSVSGQPVAIPCRVVLPDFAPAREGLASMWARERIADWTFEMRGAEGETASLLRRRITETALAAHLVSDATSMVCVDEASSVVGGLATVLVPSENSR